MLNINLKDYFQDNESIGFAVHSPELFANDHILDLCSDDLVYLEHSKKMLQRVVNITRELNQYFPKTKSPVIVLNAGGWDRNELKCTKYEMMSKSLNELNLDYVTVAIQIMPPFP
jgi:hypothetical protein